MKSILILEDDLETLSVIFRVLSESKIDFAPIVFSTYEQVEKFVNPSDMNLDLVHLRNFYLKSDETDRLGGEGDN